MGVGSEVGFVVVVAPAEGVEPSPPAYQAGLRHLSCAGVAFRRLLASVVLVDPVGFEPTRIGLKGRRSSTELQVHRPGGCNRRRIWRSRSPAFLKVAARSDLLDAVCDRQHNPVRIFSAASARWRGGGGWLGQD